MAIPFAPEFQDVYEFGIYRPVRSFGFICEKVDETSFTGDILNRIRDRIESARFVIADLTGGRPNVYLEVGYAWGKGIPVIFLARKEERLHFDVQTHRCIYYNTIGQLGKDLERLIEGLCGGDAPSSLGKPSGGPAGAEARDISYGYLLIRSRLVTAPIMLRSAGRIS